LAGATSAHPTFTASAVGTDVFRLTVGDGSGETPSDTVAVAVRYGFTGFSDPSAGQSFKTGGPTVKVRLQLLNAAGQAIGPVTPPPQLQFVKQGAGSATVTGPFTFDPKKKVFGFDINTKGAGFSPGVWNVSAILSDGTTHTVTIQLK